MIEIINLTKKYSETKIAVDNLNLTINDGEIVGFIGHNGAGKSTTIKAIAGILEFNEGEILINSKSIKKEPLICKKEMAYIPDNPDLYEHLSGIKYLNFIADIYEVSKDSRNDLIHKYANLFDIEKDLASSISSYSHGMKQKIAIISALIHTPKVLLLDEPFVGLDPKASHTVKEIMREMVSNGTSIFFSSHVLEVVEKLCDRVAIIKDGKLIRVGSVEEITKDQSLENLFLELTANE